MSETESLRSTANSLNYESATAPVAVHGLTIVLLGCVVVSILSFAVWGMAYGMLADEWTKFGAGVAVAPFESDAVYRVLQISRVAVPASTVALAACLLLWVHRTNRKLRSLGAKMHYTPFRAVIYWMVPYKCVIAPFHIVKEIHASSRGVSVRKFTPLIGCWWAFWLLGNFMYLVALMGAGQRSEGESDAQFAADWSMWHAMPVPLYVVSGVLLACIVWQVDRALQVRTAPRRA